VKYPNIAPIEIKISAKIREVEWVDDKLSKDHCFFVLNRNTCESYTDETVNKHPRYENYLEAGKRHKIYLPVGFQS
jgi:hypothetical protein